MFELAVFADKFSGVPNPSVAADDIQRLPSFGTEVDVLFSMGRGQAVQLLAAVVYALHLYQFR